MAKYEMKNVLIATTPRVLVTQDGTIIGSFRVAENTPNGIANWFTIVLKGEIAEMFQASGLGKGSRMDCMGMLHVRDWDNGERSGTSIEVELLQFNEAQRGTHGCSCPNCTI